VLEDKETISKKDILEILEAEKEKKYVHKKGVPPTLEHYLKKEAKEDGSKQIVKK
jgi:hypothetical protein